MNPVGIVQNYIVVILIVINILWIILVFLSFSTDLIIKIPAESADWAAAIATTSLALMTFVEFWKRKQLEEKRYWNGMTVDIISSGTIILTNNADELIKVNHVCQSIYKGASVSDQLFILRRESFNYPDNGTLGSKYKGLLEREEAKLREDSGTERKKIINDFQVDRNWEPQLTVEGIELNPKESWNIPGSLSYRLPGGSMFNNYMYFLCIMIVSTKPGTKKKKILRQVWRYSQYQEPEGWIRVA